MKKTEAKKFALRVAKRYLESVVDEDGIAQYEILYEGGKPFDFIANDNGELVFIEVIYTDGTNDAVLPLEEGVAFPVEDISTKKRLEFERKMVSYFADDDNKYSSTQIRFDYIGLILLGDKALVRHHVNAFGSC